MSRAWLRLLEMAAIRNARKQARLPAPHISTDAVGEWIYENLIFGSVSNLGIVADEYEMGQASGWKLTGSTIWAGGNVVVLAIDIATFGEAVGSGVAAAKSGANIKGLGGAILRRGTQSAGQRVISNAVRIRRIVRYAEEGELLANEGAKTLEGGTIIISRTIKGRLFRETLKHELTHSILSVPGKGGLAAFRHHFGLTVVGRVQLARYVEEAVSEAVGLLDRPLRGTKLTRLGRAAKFPLGHGYATIEVIVPQAAIHAGRIYNMGNSVGKKISGR